MEKDEGWDDEDEYDADDREPMDFSDELYDEMVDENVESLISWLEDIVVSARDEEETLTGLKHMVERFTVDGSAYPFFRQNPERFWKVVQSYSFNSLMESENNKECWLVIFHKSQKEVSV